ncbi:hypothetical protein D3C84_514810 [compost metagenome]
MDQLRNGITHQQTTDDCGQQDAAAGGGEPGEFVYRFFDFRRRHHRRHFLDLLVDGSERQHWSEQRIGFTQRFALRVELGRARGRIDRRAGVEQVLEVLGAPGKDEHREDDPRHPRTSHGFFRIAGKRGGRFGFVFIFGIDFRIVDPAGERSGGVHGGRFPDFQETRQTGHGNQRGDHVHQHRPVIVGHEELRNRKADAGHQDRRPDLQHLAPTGKGPDQPERHQHREERQLPTNHHRQLHFIQPGDLGQRDDRCTQGAECHWRGVGDQRQARRSQRREAQADQNRAGHCHWRTETRRAFKKGAEAEGDQQQLQTAIVSDARQGILQHLERTVLGGQSVQENDVQHNPANRQQAIGCTVQRCRTGHVRRHAEGENRNQQG